MNLFTEEVLVGRDRHLIPNVLHLNEISARAEASRARLTLTEQFLLFALYRFFPLLLVTYKSHVVNVHQLVLVLKPASNREVLLPRPCQIR